MLIPVIAHDRAGFGRGLLSAGLLIVLIARNASITRSFVQVIGIMGACGFGAALRVHVAIGYLECHSPRPGLLWGCCSSQLGCSFALWRLLKGRESGPLGSSNLNLLSSNKAAPPVRSRWLFF